ncbi:MAG: hypothetical protein NTY59_05330 [Alphaproteobacteria bacterium]|nr:hypothetical protein [Alphaproteobacteria bacterium]
MKSRILTVLAVAAALAACGDKKPYVPQVDMTGHTKGQYDYDLLVCQENARQQDVAPGVVLGVTAGAAGGAIAGNAALGAMVGAVAGGAATSGYDDVATSKGSNRMVVRIRECMAAKGYKITGIDSQNADDPGPPKDWKAEPVDNIAPPPPGSEPARPPAVSQ